MGEMNRIGFRKGKLLGFSQKTVLKTQVFVNLTRQGFIFYYRDYRGRHSLFVFPLFFENVNPVITLF